MASSDFFTLEQFFSDREIVLLPYNSTIVDLKIRAINLYPKIFSSTTLILYGDYDILILYKVLSRNGRSRYFYKSSKSTILRSINISKLTKQDNLKEDDILISLKTGPQCDYRLFNRPIPRLAYRYFTLCIIDVSAEFLFSLAAYLNDSDSDVSYTNDEPNHSFIAPDLVKDSSLEILDSIQYNSKAFDYCINSSDKKILTDPPSYLPSTDDFNTNMENNPLPPTVSTTNKISYPIEKFSKIIYAKSIIGNGCKDIFLNKSISLPLNTPPIWKIGSIDHYVNISKVDITTDSVFIDGTIYMHIIYKTLCEADLNISSGNLNFIDIHIPFSNYIKIDKDNSIILKDTDSYKILDSKVLGHSYTLLNLNNQNSNECLFDTIEESVIFNINILILRSTLLEIPCKTH